MFVSFIIITFPGPTNIWAELMIHPFGPISKLTTIDAGTEVTSTPAQYKPHEWLIPFFRIECNLLKL